MRKLQLLAGLVISALALYAVLHDIEWSAVSQSVRGADYWQLALAAGLLVGTHLLRAVRWGLVLKPARAHYWHLFGSLNAAYFINNLLPLQLGDLGRAYLLSELSGFSMTRTLSTVVVERVIDVLTLLLLLLVLTLFIDIPGVVRTPSLVLALAFGGLAVLIIAMSTRKQRALRLVDLVLGVAPAAARPKLRGMAANAIDGFQVLTRPRSGGRLLAVSIVLWLGVGLVVYTGINAFDLGLGYGAALFLVVATTFGFFVPSTPGAFGVYHAIVTAVLVSVFGVEKSVAVGFALVVHMVFYLPPMLVGPAFLWLERDLWRQSSFWSKLRELRGVPVAK